MKAVTFGGAMIDSIALIDSDRIEQMVMRNADTSFLLLEEGRKTEAKEISNHIGGGAVNTAVSMARLGVDVSTVIKLGFDQRADQVLQQLQEETVSTRWAMRDKRAPTGASVLIASHERDAAIFTFRGANTLLEREDLKEDMFSVGLTFISGLSNESADCFPDIVKMAKAQGSLVAANPGIRQLSTRAGSFREALKTIDILTLNRREADALVPGLIAQFGEGGPTLAWDGPGEPPPLLARGFSSGGFEMSIRGFFNALHSMGPRWIVVTVGGSGAFVGSAEGTWFCPPVPVDIQGTAGAGDSFASTVAVFIAEGLPVEDALLAGTLNAASVIGYADTQTGLLKRDVLAARMAEMAPVVQVRQWANS